MGAIGIRGTDTTVMEPRTDHLIDILTEAREVREAPPLDMKTAESRDFLLLELGLTHSRLLLQVLKLRPPWNRLGAEITEVYEKFITGRYEVVPKISVPTAVDSFSVSMILLTNQF